MPRKALRSFHPPTIPANGGRTMYDSTDYRFLLGIQRQALQYFLDNQTPAGLVLDRQSNHGPPRQQMCSIAATGMGFIAQALATGSPYRLLPRQTAVRRIEAGLGTALDALPCDHGILPHFVDARTHAP